MLNENNKKAFFQALRNEYNDVIINNISNYSYENSIIHQLLREITNPFLSSTLTKWHLTTPKAIICSCDKSFLNDCASLNLWKSEGNLSLEALFQAMNENISNITEKDSRWENAIDRLVYLICVVEKTCTTDWNAISLLPSELNVEMLHRDVEELCFLKELSYVWNQSIEWLNKNDPAQSFAIIVPYLERTLQQIVYGHKKYVKQCKSITIAKLSVLIEDESFITIFGTNFATLISMITKLQGLSLRNVILHGYSCSTEWFSGYTTFILALTRTIVHEYMLKNWNITFESDDINWKHQRDQNNEIIYDRPFDISLNDDAQLETFCTVKEEHLHIDTFKLLNRKTQFVSHDCLEAPREDLHSLLEFFNQSLFVIPGHSHCWMKIMQDFSEGNYYSCIIRLYPHLEAGLRRVYIHENNSPDWYFVASGESLLVTIDICLTSTILFDDSKPENKLFHRLGIIYQNVLYDMFVWEKCIRFRDVICHGGCPPSTISSKIAAHLLNLGLALCANFSSNKKELPFIVRKSIEYIEDQYIPMYHPLNTLDRVSISTFRSTDNLNRVSQQIFKLFSNNNNNTDNIEALDPIVKVFEKSTPSTSWIQLYISCSKFYSYLVEKTRKLDETLKYVHFETNLRQIYHGTQMYECNLSETLMRTILRMTEIYKQIFDAIEALQDQYIDLYQLNITRKASQKKRDALLAQLLLFPSIFQFIQIIYKRLKHYHAQILQSMTESRAKETSQVLTDIYNSVGSITSLIKTNKLLSAFETMVAFSIDPINLSIILPEFQFKTLSRKAIGLHTNLVKREIFLDSNED